MCKKPTHEELEPREQSLEGLALKIKRAETDLKKNLRFTESLLLAIPTPAYFKDVKGCYLGCNRAFTDFTGLAPEQIRGKTVHEVWYSEHAEAYHQKDLELMRNAEHQIYEFVLRDKHGDNRTVIFHKDVFLDEHDEVAGLVGTFNDITDFKRVEKELGFAKFAIEKSESKFFWHDPDCKIVYANDYACKTLGYPRNELIGSFLWQYDPVFPKEQWPQVWENLKQEKTLTFETLHRRKNGTTVPVEVTAHYLVYDGREYGFVFTRDISERKAIEKGLEAYRERLEKLVAERTTKAEQRAKQLQQLALELSHAEDRERQQIATILHDDLQQLLAYIKMKLGMLISSQRSDIQDTVSVVHLEQLIGDSIEKCRNLSYELIPPVLRRNGLLAALRWLRQDMIEKNGLKVVLRVSADAEPPSPALASILFRSIRELLINVVKHSTVQCAWVNARKKGGRIQISVMDRGKGFDYDAVKAEQGADAGFGLFSIEDRIYSLGGHMDIQSAPGKGCCIKLEVPADFTLKTDKVACSSTGDGIHELTENETRNKNVEPGKNGHIRILLADDHALMREALANMLEGYEGFKVVGQAVNGKEAVLLAIEFKPDVVLMDVSMPEMNGFDATAQIRAALPDTRIIGLSMYNEEDTQQKMLNAGASAYLTKTGSQDTLIATIRQVYLEGRKITRW